MSWRFNIITTATDRLSESWKLCLNLCSQRWLKPNLNLVNNLTLLGLWQLKTVLSEGRMKFKSVFLKRFKLSEMRIFRSSLFHSITAEGKKEFRKKLYFTLNREILLVFLALYVLTEVGIILNRYFGHLYLKILKKQHSFLDHLLFSRVSTPSSSYSFSLDAPLIAPAIGNAALNWIESSLWWNEALYAWSYMMSKYKNPFSSKCKKTNKRDAFYFSKSTKCRSYFSDWKLWCTIISRLKKGTDPTI